MGEVADQCLGDAIAEIVGAGIATRVGEGEHGDGIGAEVGIARVGGGLLCGGAGGETGGLAVGVDTGKDGDR